nr:MAG TPA: hypothetical protein [Caudoviricetes sp.]
MARCLTTKPSQEGFLFAFKWIITLLEKFKVLRMLVTAPLFL